MSRITPEQLAKSGTEQAIQTAFFCALADLRAAHPETKWIYAVPNGGKRDQVTASRMKAAGVRAGVWDVHLPFPRGRHPFGYIEFKVAAERNHKHGGLSPEQIEFGDAMHAQGAFLRAAYGWEEALGFVRDYLALPPPAPMG